MQESAEKMAKARYTTHDLGRETGCLRLALAKREVWHGCSSVTRCQTKPTNSAANTGRYAEHRQPTDIAVGQKTM